LEGTLIPWLARLRQTLLQLYPLGSGQQPVPDDIFLAPDWELKLDEDDSSYPQPALENKTYLDTSTTPAVSVADHEKNGTPGPINSTSASSDHNDSILGPGTFEATVTRNQRFTPEDHWQDVRLFEFSTPRMDYHPGDVLTIFPHNTSSSVDKLIALMQWESIADKTLHFAPSDPKNTPSSPPPQVSPSKTALTLRHLLTTHLDLNAIPRRSFFANLSHFTTDEFQHNRLIEFTAPEYVDELFDYTTRPRRSIIEVLDEFDTVKIPWKWITSILPSIRGRQYSIASGGELKTSENGSKGRIELLIAMVKYRTVIKKTREGLCSRYMSGLEVGQKLNVLLCKGGMRVTMDKPAVMIGPGTGVAPLRSMTFELAAQNAGEDGNRAVQRQKQLLFYGGRNQTKDYFFENDWSQLGQTLDLDVFTAWSRDQVSDIPLPCALGNCLYADGLKANISSNNSHQKSTFKTSSNNKPLSSLKHYKQAPSTSAAHQVKCPSQYAQHLSMSSPNKERCQWSRQRKDWRRWRRKDGISRRLGRYRRMVNEMRLYLSI